MESIVYKPGGKKDETKNTKQSKRGWEQRRKEKR